MNEKLLQVLLDQTREDKLVWEPTAQGDHYLAHVQVGLGKENSFLLRWDNSDLEIVDGYDRVKCRLRLQEHGLVSLTEQLLREIRCQTFGTFVSPGIVEQLRDL